jgi:hypothetical protein
MNNVGNGFDWKNRRTKRNDAVVPVTMLVLSS